MPLLRFHWDFFGPDARPTAEHFLKHLDQFCDREGIRGFTRWVREEKVRCTAILECEEKHLLTVRDRLRPVRGERVLEE
jgi:hypothetical protein